MIASFFAKGWQQLQWISKAIESRGKNDQNVQKKFLKPLLYFSAIDLYAQYVPNCLIIIIINK